MIYLHPLFFCTYIQLSSWIFIQSLPANIITQVPFQLLQNCILFCIDFLSSHSLLNPSQHGFSPIISVKWILQRISHTFEQKAFSDISELFLLKILSSIVFSNPTISPTPSLTHPPPIWPLTLFLSLSPKLPPRAISHVLVSNYHLHSKWLPNLYLESRLLH